MKNTVKSREEDADASSSFSDLPDEIILQILNKVIDLKTLSFCYLVCRRFSSIVLEVDAICFTAHLNSDIPAKNTVGDVAPSRLVPGASFLSANVFLRKFKGVKSLCIKLPFSSKICSINRFLFKWMVKFGSRFESFMFLSPNSFFDMVRICLNGNKDEDPLEEIKQKFKISVQCMKKSMEWHMMLLNLVKNLPELEKVSITDSGRRVRLSLSGEKLIEVKEMEWSHSASETEFNHVIPEGGNDDLMKSEDVLEDKEEALYNEALKEILEKHKDWMLTWADLVL